MSDVAERPVRKSVSLPASSWQQIDNFRFAKRIRTESEAIRRLVELGLQKAADPGSNAEG
jgi:metal-responsive CopG/Arc/MetJ family transcriptional regulator